ncbi:Pentatricopeptide repeat-containing protein [Striga hermonthica]|uniref:Pentatricopeptide repeat-containing protein n=1 Tax=Striga hermonthica TaxID=68872 RepID=A0A9N7NLE1_STRHE|nr:Pentatricopeptide repeat-containing protein [Striga hermonthica]
MLLSSSHRQGYSILRPLNLKLLFSSQTATAQRCLEPSSENFTSDPNSTSRALSDLISSGKFHDVLSLLSRIPPSPSLVFFWNILIKSSVSSRNPRESLRLFREMRRLEWAPDDFTYPYTFKACGDLPSLLAGSSVHARALVSGYTHSNEIHGHAVRTCLIEDVFVGNAVIDMYAKCELFDEAKDVFERMPVKDVVSWNALVTGYSQVGKFDTALRLFEQMREEEIELNVVTWSAVISAYAQRGLGWEALDVFREMVGSGSEPNAVTFVSVLSASAACCGLTQGKETHCFILKRAIINSDRNGLRVGDEMMVINGLIDMYAKSGLPVDGVTFVVVLYACSHSGMIERGMEYFYRMERDFRVLPGVEHYACMVDLLGRAGRLDEALELVEKMPMKPNPIVWVALLSGCRLHRNVELGELAVNRLLELNFENDGLYTLLSNLYASARRWKDVAKVRLLMKKSGIRKRPGCSWVQGKNGTAVFYVGDKSHPMANEIYCLLDDLISQAKKMGYVPETVFALHDVDEEEKRELLLEHSEKLALAYGILTTTPRLPIRITKNLRVCGDCHTAIMYISKIVENEIVLRDSSRFHHFKNGSCSCKGVFESTFVGRRFVVKERFFEKMDRILKAYKRSSKQWSSTTNKLAQATSAAKRKKAHDDWLN